MNIDQLDLGFCLFLLAEELGAGGFLIFSGSPETLAKGGSPTHNSNSRCCARLITWAGAVCACPASGEFAASRADTFGTHLAQASAIYSCT